MTHRRKLTSVSSCNAMSRMARAVLAHSLREWTKTSTWGRIGERGQSKVLTKPHTGKEKPHPSTTTEGSKPCVTK